MKSKNLKLMSLLLVLLISERGFTLSLDDYLSQVKSENREKTGAEDQAKAATLKSSEAGLIFTPQFFLNAQFGSDGKPATPPLLTYDKIQTENYSAGLSQQFSFGAQAKLYYTYAHTNFVNSPLLTGNSANLYDVNPVLELSMPLWGNGFGRTSQAQYLLIREESKAERFHAQGLSKQIEINAERTYWGLGIAREILEIQMQALSQAQEILNYVSKKAQMRLGEDGDILQAKALVAVRNLELKRAQSDESVARKEFNAMRNQISDEVSEQVDKMPYEMVESFTFPLERPSDRYDVKESEAQLKIATANSQLIEERNRPTFDVYGGYGLNGRGDGASNALSGVSAGTDKDTKFVGLKMVIPLDFSASNKVRAGARMTASASQEQFHYRQLAQEKDWQVLIQRLQDSKDTLGLANQLVAAQSAKLIRENQQLKQGRTTTYQVLLFEQDKSQAEISRAQIALQIVALRSGLKAYQNQISEEDK